MQNDEQPKLVKLSEGFYVRQEIDNIGWADMGDGILVVDALEHAELADEVIALIEETVPGKPVRTVLNTHTHYDHVALNPVFEKKYDAAIINRRTRDIPENGLRLQGEERECRFVPMPGAHTNEDCVAWFPGDRVLFVGDLFGWGLITSMTSATGEVMTGLEAIYNRLIDFQAEHVVPGHGPLCSTQELIKCRDYHLWLAEEVLAGTEKGRRLNELIADIAVPEDMRDWWRLDEWKHEQNIRKLFKGSRR